MYIAKLRAAFSRISIQRSEIIPIAAFAIAAALILGFGLLAEEVLDGDTAAFDRRVFQMLRTPGDLAAPIGPAWLQEFARDMTTLGSFAFIGILSAGVVGYLLLTGRRALGILVLVAVVGGTLISDLLKFTFDRPRPPIPHAVAVFTASFPSGHATLSAITFLTLGALLARAHRDRRVKIYFIVLAILLSIAVGISRVYLGVHFASDVLAGWCVGSAWAILCWTVARRLQSPGDR